MMVTAPHKSPLGPVIGVIIILALILIGGFYFWGEQQAKNAPLVEPAPQNEAVMPSNGQTPAETVEEDATMMQLQVQSQSDDLSSIEADLNATDFTSLDAGVEEIQ